MVAQRWRAETATLVPGAKWTGMGSSYKGYEFLLTICFIFEACSLVLAMERIDIPQSGVSSFFVSYPSA